MPANFWPVLGIFVVLVAAALAALAVWLAKDVKAADATATDVPAPTTPRQEGNVIPFRRAAPGHSMAHIENQGAAHALVDIASGRPRPNPYPHPSASYMFYQLAYQRVWLGHDLALADANRTQATQ